MWLHGAARLGDVLRGQGTLCARTLTTHAHTRTHSHRTRTQVVIYLCEGAVVAFQCPLQDGLVVLQLEERFVKHAKAAKLCRGQLVHKLKPDLHRCGCSIEWAKELGVLACVGVVFVLGIANGRVTYSAARGQCAQTTSRLGLTFEPGLSLSCCKSQPGTMAVFSGALKLCTLHATLSSALEILRTAARSSRGFPTSACVFVGGERACTQVCGNAEVNQNHSMAMHDYPHAHKYTQTHVHTQTHAHTHVHTHAHMHVRTYTRMYTHTRTHARTHART